LLGLVFGKPAGVFLFSWLSVKSGIASLPRGVNWWHIYGVSLLLETTKLAIFAASIIAALGGLIVLWLASGRERRTS
jgi:NhaA family Na+:H+ antiporter